MAVTSYDLVTVGSDYTSADLILWRRYRNRAPGMLLDVQHLLSEDAAEMVV